ncbi:MAG: hypothetical protein R3F59_17145 [Myxococcota bacterium]
MLQFGNVDAVILPASAAERLLASTQMALVRTPAAESPVLPALSALDAGRRGALEAAVRGLPAEVNGKVGVDRWGAP